MVDLEERMLVRLEYEIFLEDVFGAFSDQDRRVFAGLALLNKILIFKTHNLKVFVSK